MHPLLARHAARTHTGDLPPPPPAGSAANTAGIVVALAVLALSVAGLRAANRSADRWGGPGGRA